MTAEKGNPATGRPALYVAIVLVAMLGTFAYKLRFEGVFACPIADKTDSFLADCHATGYADYDHGAFWFDLEPSALRAAHDANVLFLGSSRLQFGLSSPSTKDWFSKSGISFYLLGFSYTENVAFVTPLLDKIHPQASVYVINVDRFFSDIETVPATEILKDRDARNRYAEKRFWQRVQEPLCRTLSWFCGNEVAFFRERDTGMWYRKGVAPFKPSDIGNGPATNTDRWPQFEAIAQRFVEQLPVTRECVLLTILPYDETRRAEAEAIAGSLGLDLLTPNVRGLRTFDGSHLDPESADRWSAAFFELAGPQIQRCLAESRRS
jgi:hypothetical protein